ncbi:MAG: DNA replication/repair protein RecF [Clostridia bacterium]|nr:DNA replication/repair protein RecF [Clostridia bacterium]
MIIETLRLRDFRNYESLEISPDPEMNLIFGPNGSGKTNLLEAVLYCAIGKSHRLTSDRDAVRRGAAWGACGVTVAGPGGARTEIALRIQAGEGERLKKTVFIGKKRASRMADLMGRVRCVIFSPEDLEIVRGGPVHRRRYMDTLLCQLDPVYFGALSRYNRALEARNALLRAPVPDDEQTASYEGLMAGAAAAVIARREKAMREVSRIAEEKCAAIGGRPDEVFTMAYVPCAAPDPEALAAMWRESRAGDRLRKTTSAGPHREDILLRLNGRDMRSYASQGQVRTAALAMKLSQLRWIRDMTGDTPVLLLDDVMSELDMDRRGRLLEEIRGAQTLITCTDESDVRDLRGRRTYRVSAEGGTARAEETRRGDTPSPAAPPADDIDDELG